MAGSQVFTFRQDIPMVDGDGKPLRHFTHAYDSAASGVFSAVTGPASSVDGQAALFSGTTGKVLRAFTSSGMVLATSGVLSTTLAPGIFEGTTQVLTNAQIKALPTTPITLVAAQGASTRIVPVQVDLVASFTTGYTNIDTTFAYIGGALTNGQAGWTNVILNDGSIPRTLLSTFLGAGTWQTTLVMQTDPEPVAQAGNLPYIYAISGLSYNVAYQLVGGNNGAGNWTGGNVLNTLTVTPWYSVVSY